LKIPRWALILVIAVIIAVVGISAIALLQSGGPPCTATWACAAGYPVQGVEASGAAGERCVASSAYIYCVGGVDTDGRPHNGTYSGLVSQNGNLTGWTNGVNVYPQDISGESCVLSSGYLYCTGGFHDATADDTASSYYAQLTPDGGVGTWYYAKAFPVSIDSASCVAASSYIYCIAGNNETDGTNGTVQPSDTTWYAALSSTGIGSWNQTSSYPAGTYLPSCAAAGDRVYCVGGVDSNENPLGNSYYAALGPTGIGEWVPTTSYPLPSTGQACDIAGGYIYCVGGATTGGQTRSFTDATYFASITPTGMGQWKEGPSYPEPVQTSCTILGSRLYCIGGLDESAAGVSPYVRYALLASFGA
jgi:hypothetical protein